MANSLNCLILHFIYDKIFFERGINMKKFLTVICCIFTFIVSFAFVGCGSKPYNITFVVSDEVWQVVKSNKLDELPIPTKEYCDFAGWYIDGEEISLKDLDAECTVYAKWTLNENYQCVSVLGNSMAPEIFKDDYVIVDITVTEFNVGDVIMHTTNSSTSRRVSRIVSIDGGIFTTKKDASQSNDAETITSVNIVGLVCKNLGQDMPEFKK